MTCILGTVSSKAAAARLPSSACNLNYALHGVGKAVTLREDSDARSEATFSCSSAGTLPCARLSLLPAGLLAVGRRITCLAPSRSREYSLDTRLPVLFFTLACTQTSTL